MKENQKNKIINSLKNIKEKRKSQQCICVEFEIITNKTWSKEYFNRLFNEFKWLYNWTLSDFDNRKKEAEKIKSVQIKVGNSFENRDLIFLSSQMKQAVVANLTQNMTALKKAKDKNLKIGKLKYKKDNKVVYFPTQAFKIIDNRFKLQNMPRGKTCYLRGIKQFKKLNKIFSYIDYGDSKIIKKVNKFYFQLTCFVSKQEWLNFYESQQINEYIGVDFGIKHPLVMSNGIKLNFSIKESERLKKLQKKLSKQKKHSYNYKKTKIKIQLEYLKNNNKKRNIRNQILGFLRKYKYLCYQKELIKLWHQNWFGKQIQNTSIGSILDCFSRHLNPLMIESEIPTTKKCHICNYINDIKLDDRIFKCQKCGIEIDRDIHSALNMIHMNFPKIPLEQGKLTPVEIKTAELIFGFIPDINLSFVNEAGSHNP